MVFTAGLSVGTGGTCSPVSWFGVGIASEDITASGSGEAGAGEEGMATDGAEETGSSDGVDGLAATSKEAARSPGGMSVLAGSQVAGDPEGGWGSALSRTVEASPVSLSLFEKSSLFSIASDFDL